MSLPPTNFYPRPPRGGRRGPSISAGSLSLISTHALREEGDQAGHGCRHGADQFLPTPSVRRATHAGL